MCASRKAVMEFIRIVVVLDAMGIHCLTNR